MDNRSEFKKNHLKQFGKILSDTQADQLINTEKIMADTIKMLELECSLINYVLLNYKTLLNTANSIHKDDATAYVNAFENIITYAKDVYNYLDLDNKDNTTVNLIKETADLIKRVTKK